MSLGYCGYANLQEADDTLVIYSYCCYNLNIEGYKRFENAEDGELYIDRDAFVEPEIHEKLKKMPSGRNKLIVKRVKRDFPFGEYFDKGKDKSEERKRDMGNQSIRYRLDGLAYPAQSIRRVSGDREDTGTHSMV